jgi:hypothetical protein
LGYQAKTSVTKRVDLSGDYYALIHMLRSDDEDALQAVLLGGAKNRGKVRARDDGTTDTEFDVEQDMAAYQRQMIVRAVSEWNLDDDVGQILPVNEQSVRLLTAADRNTLVREIKALSETLSKKNGSTTAGG